MQIANHVHLKLIYVNYISVLKNTYMCIYFFSKRRCVGGEWMKRHKSTHQGNNKFISAQRQVLLKTYHPPEEICWFLWVQRWGALCMRKHEFWPDPCWSPHDSGLLIPAKRSEFPFSLPHLLPALSCLCWMVSGCGSWMTGVQWKQTTMLRASSLYLSDVNDITGRPQQECECERHHTCCFFLTPAEGFPGHRGKPRSWGKWSRIPAPYSGEPPLREECTSTPVPDYRGWRHRHDLPGFTSSHAGGITWAISWYQHFLPPPLSGSSRPSWGIPSLPRPSWGSPQSPQAFQGESPASPGLPGGTPQLPWVLPESPRIWRPQTVWSLGHMQCPANSLLTTQCVCWNPRPWSL